MTEVELQCVPAYRLHAKEAGASLTELLPVIQAEADATDHLDLLWFPHTDRVLTKRNDVVGPGEGPPPLPRVAVARWRTTCSPTGCSRWPTGWRPPGRPWCPRSTGSARG